jgi:hypothetical protein
VSYRFNGTGKQMAPQSTYSWIFISLAMASSAGPAGLREILGAADYIDHSIPTHEELRGSLGWLIARGFIESTDRRYSLTGAGREFYDEASARSAYVHKMRPRIEEKFAGLDPGSLPEPITVGEFQFALDLYYKGT